jgi:hypothetical protein
MQRHRAAADDSSDGFEGSLEAEVSDWDGEFAEVFETIVREEQVGYSFYRGTPSTLFGPEHDGVVRLTRGMYSKAGQLEALAALLARGESIRKAIAQAGGSKWRAIKLRRVLELETGSEFLCKCGASARHKGFCAPRLEASAARKAYLSQFKKVPT